MNRLVRQYRVSVDFPDVSGAEHLEMLQIRDQLMELQPSLSAEEQEALAEADRLLMRQSAKFHAEVSRFVNLEQERRRRDIPASRWWWYLDVVSNLPLPVSAATGSM